MNLINNVMIGLPINGTKIRVTDKQGWEMPEYFSGELYLNEKGLAQGYWNQPELTTESIINEPIIEIRS